MERNYTIMGRGLQSDLWIPHHGVGTVDPSLLWAFSQREADAETVAFLNRLLNSFPITPHLHMLIPNRHGPSARHRSGAPSSTFHKHPHVRGCPIYFDSTVRLHFYPGASHFHHHAWLKHAARSKRPAVRRLARFFQALLTTSPLPVHLQASHKPGEDNHNADLVLSRPSKAPTWASVTGLKRKPKRMNLPRRTPLWRRRRFPRKTKTLRNRLHSPLSHSKNVSRQSQRNPRNRVDHFLVSLHGDVLFVLVVYLAEHVHYWSFQFHQDEVWHEGF